MDGSSGDSALFKADHRGMKSMHLSPAVSFNRVNPVIAHFAVVLHLSALTKEIPAVYAAALPLVNKNITPSDHNIVSISI